MVKACIIEESALKTFIYSRVLLVSIVMKKTFIAFFYIWIKSFFYLDALID
jgi:hypothetical protein